MCSLQDPACSGKSFNLPLQESARCPIITLEPRHSRPGNQVQKQEEKVKKADLLGTPNQQCKPSPDEPEGPCQACIKVARNRSQKRIHNIGCHRYKLQEVSLFRTTRLRYTKRWQGAQIRDVPTFGEPVTIWIYQGLATPLAITVRRYEFGKMDPRTIVARKWADPHGAYREQSDFPYALANVNETKDWYREYITAHKFEAYSRMIYQDADDQWDGCDAIIKDIYRLAHENHYDQLPTGARCNFYRPPEKWDFKQISEENFMAGIFEMWFAMSEFPQAIQPSFSMRGEADQQHVLVTNTDHTPPRSQDKPPAPRTSGAVTQSSTQPTGTSGLAMAGQP